MFTTELEKMIPHMRAYARMLCRNRDMADDVVQNACLKAWDARDRFDPTRGSFKAWIFTITRNEFLQLVRKQRPVDYYAPEDFETRLIQDCELERRNDCSDAINQLFQLNREQRDVFILVVAVGYSYEEAAKICGCSVGTIKSRINRARAKLTEMRSEEAETMDPKGTGHMSFHDVQDILGYVEDLVQNAA
ncbi:MAG: sigma-70 family RNA polymerase sigma factor [Pseudomonadota bacterium]